MDKSLLPIGVFDSGVGGISVLRELMSVLPSEEFIYFGDSKNAPYGTKSHEEIFRLTERNVALLVDEGVKAVVIACNTATSVCIDDLREKYSDIPIVGIEPALKPAVMYKPNPTVLVMATPLTLKEEKFAGLCREYGDKATIIPLPCPKLVEFVESGNFEGEEIEGYLSEKLASVNAANVDCVVLGCTHFPFVKATVKKLFADAEIFDGGYGTAKQLKRCLEDAGTLNTENYFGKITVLNSLENRNISALIRRLLNQKF